MCLSIHDKKGTLWQNDGIIWETREVRERSGVFISLKSWFQLMMFDEFVCSSGSRNDGTQASSCTIVMKVSGTLILIENALPSYHLLQNETKSKNK